MKINLKQVICISLKSHTEDQLDAIGATYNISHEFLVKAKNDGCKKIWLHINGGIVIAGLDTDNMEDVYFSPDYFPNLTTKIRKAVLAIKPVKTPKMPTWAKVPKTKTSNQSGEHQETKKSQPKKPEYTNQLDLDSILDKISQWGIDSLTTGEKDYLDKVSKN